ncbi:MAG: hypothetical protein KDA32_13295, partial [Phycisphaerales bacterium]|nr:hypothetical protein [Phycisphaerales bacterium]
MRGVLCVVFALASVSAAGAQLVQNPEMIIPKGPALEEGLKVISLQAVDLTIPVTDAQRVPYVLRQLQLSEDQKARIQPLVAEYLTNPEAHKKELERRDRVKQLRESQ